MRDSGLTPSEVIEIRSVINRYINARGWMKRNYDKASDDETKRYHMVAKLFDDTWAKFKVRMSEEDIDKFTGMLESDTVAPDNHKHSIDFEKRPPDEETARVDTEKKPSEYKPPKKSIVVKQISKPNIKNNQPELF